MVPTVPSRQMQHILHHELARITPFAASDLFWHWQARARTSNRARTGRHADDGAAPGACRHGDQRCWTSASNPTLWRSGRPRRPTLLPVDAGAGRAVGTILTRGLIWGCAALAIVALVLPVALQALAFHQTEAAIADLQPTIAQVDALRRGIAAGDAGRDILTQEFERTGDVLQTLAAVTRILPDDTYLTDFSLRDRQMTLSGRSAAAPRLITGLSADPAIRNAAFAAPVTRIEGATADLFSIKAEVAK